MDRRHVKVCVIDRTIGNPSGIILTNNLNALKEVSELSRTKNKITLVTFEEEEDVSWKDDDVNNSCLPMEAESVDLNLILSVSASSLVSRGRSSYLRQNSEKDRRSNQAWCLFVSSQHQPSSNFRNSVVDSSACLIDVVEKISQGNSQNSFTDYFIGHSAH